MNHGVTEFEQRVVDCLGDIRAFLPGLRLRYDMFVITRAMAEHVGLALWALRDKALCDDRQARLALAHLEAAAFPREERPMP